MNDETFGYLQSLIERLDDKSSNDTQTSTIVYGKVCEE
jgi:hypothetical protein